MYLVYHPDGSDEPQRWEYLPTKLMSAEREKLERLSGRDFSDFTKGVISGNSLCRRALLFVYLKRQHPTTRFDDVDFAWDELKVEYSKGELQKMRDEVAERLSGPERDAALDQLDAEIATAYEDEGKVQPPIAG